MLQFTQLTNGKGRAEAEKVKIFIFFRPLYFMVCIWHSAIRFSLTFNYQHVRFNLASAHPASDATWF